MQRVFERCAGLDVHRDTVTACVRVPGGSGERVQETQTFATTTRSLLVLRDWLAAHQVTVVGMESTGVLWKPVYYALEDDFECWLLNAQHLRAVPGRKNKTDVKDAEWICQLVEHGLVRPSFVPPKEIRELRDLTRYRKAMIQERTREAQRLEKMLQDASVKLSSVASQVMGVSGRAMVEALVAGTTDVEAIADLAKGVLRKKIPQLREALEGHFGQHHAFMVGHLLSHIDHLDEIIDSVSAEIERVLLPFKPMVELLDTIPGVNQRTAEVLLAEFGTDMSRFASAAHLASWAGMCPGNNESAGKHRSGRTRKGPKHLREALVEAANAASKTKGTYLRAQYERFARRQGRKKAKVSVGHTILVIAYHMLTTNQPYQDLGADYFESRRDREVHIRRLVRQLENLGHRVTLEILPDPA